MKRRIGMIALLAILGLSSGRNVLACGDKFLVVGRGTRFQRPKTVRPASILIYSNPASGLPEALRSLSVESLLKQAGHRPTKVETHEQLIAALAGGHFDVVLADVGDATEVEGLASGIAGGPVVVPVCLGSSGKTPHETGKDLSCVVKSSKEQPFLEAIDQAVKRVDANASKLSKRA